MTLPIFPIPLGLTGNTTFFKWSPRFFNQSQKTISGASIDIALAALPIHDFEFIVSWLRDPGTTPGAAVVTGSEWRAVQAFFMALGGSRGRFLFLNPDDNNVTNQAIGTGDGSTFLWIAARSFGDPSVATLFENVGQVKSIFLVSPQVFLNGVLQVLGTDYVLDTSVPGQNLFNFTVTPGVGVAITATFTYYYYCKFVDDTMTFDKFINQLWANQSIKIQSCRVGA